MFPVQNAHEAVASVCLRRQIIADTLDNAAVIAQASICIPSAFFAGLVDFLHSPSSVHLSKAVEILYAMVIIPMATTATCTTLQNSSRNQVASPLQLIARISRRTLPLVLSRVLGPRAMLTLCRIHRSETLGAAWGVPFRVLGLRFWVLGLGLRVWGL